MFTNMQLVRGTTMERKTVGLKTIAAELGVSINTVSRALRDCSDISKSTKEKVCNKALELGYVPNAIARSLVNGNSKLIALIFNNLTNPYFSIMADKVARSLKAHGYKAVIMPLFSTVFSKVEIKECISQCVDGIISFLIPGKEAVAIAKANHIPMVLVGRCIESNYVDMVYTDDAAGGALAAEYIAAGERREGRAVYIGVDGIECSERRYQGFRERMAELAPALEVGYLSEKDLDDGIDPAFFSELAGTFAFNDQIAMKFILAKDRLAPAARMRLVGFDAVSKRLEWRYDLTSVSFDYNRIADRAVEIIVARIEKKEGGENRKDKYDVHLHYGLT